MLSKILFKVQKLEKKKRNESKHEKDANLTKKK